jgi:hypothetical protein
LTEAAIECQFWGYNDLSIGIAFDLPEFSAIGQVPAVSKSLSVGVGHSPMSALMKEIILPQSVNCIRTATEI